MTPKVFLPFCLAVFAAFAAHAQDSAQRTAPFTDAEREAVYTAAIARRADAALRDLGLEDTNRAARVHAAIVAQYRALRARDEAMDVMFAALGKNAPGVETNRDVLLPILSRQLHHQFLVRLAEDLTPEQIDKVKDRMTYHKVQVTYDTYGEILTNLTPAEKAKILEWLKVAREEAMDGGSHDEKSAIFQKYKDQINAYLTANGHNVAQAFREWEAKHATIAQGDADASASAR